MNTDCGKGAVTKVLCYSVFTPTEGSVLGDLCPDMPDISTSLPADILEYIKRVGWPQYDIEKDRTREILQWNHILQT